MRQTRSLVTTYYLQIPFDDMKFKLILAIHYLQIPFDDMKFKLILAILFDKWKSVNDFYELGHVTFSKNVFWSVNCTLPLYQIYPVQSLTL